jgi:inner membrane protein
MALSDVTGAMRSPGLKFLLIVVLTLAMVIPLFFIQLALSDRESSARDAVQDIASGWGGSQIAAGPVLFVPYSVVRQTVVDGKTVQATQYLTAVLLPEDLRIGVDAKIGERWRGIFKVPVYRAAVDIHATFDQAALATLVPADATVQWDKVYLSVLVSDAHGLADNVALTVNDKKIAFLPGLGLPGAANVPAGFNGAASGGGIHALLGLTGAANLKVDTSLVLRGSREFSVSPLGKRSTVTVKSQWASPSFFGSFLPSERTITEKGFNASWTVPYLARGFGQTFDTPESALQNILAPSFGVRFYQPVDHYQLVERSLKYAILFVALAFLIFFVVEIVTAQRLHAIQYALIGAAQVLFYLLLLSLAEHFGFAVAYLVASGATVALTALYALSALASRLRAAILFGVLAILYGLLYAILNSEDNALLIGSGVLFAALAATMYVTRQIDWYRIGAPQT